MAIPSRTDDLLYTELKLELNGPDIGYYLNGGKSRLALKSEENDKAQV